MTNKIQLLTILAVIQIVLIAVIWLQNDPLQGRSQQTTLLTFNSDEINRIVINDQESSVQLNKADANWQTSDNFPADQAQINALLGKLSTLKSGLPVATTSSALNRFKVSEDNFERLIQLQKDDELIAQLYLGGGAGARRTHARNAEQTSVYSIAMAGYDAPAKLDNWYDKTVLQFSKDEVSAVKLGETELIKEEDKEQSTWKLSAAKDNQELNQNSLNEGISELSGLRFNKLLGTEKKPEYNLKSPELTLDLSFKDNSKRRYHLSKKQDSEDYILKASNREEYFQVAAYTANALLEKLTTNLWIEKKENNNESSSATNEDEKKDPKNLEISQQK